MTLHRLPIEELDDLMPSELEALEKHCRDEGWVCERMAEQVAKGNVPELKLSTWAERADWYRERARQFAGLAAARERDLDELEAP